MQPAVLLTDSDCCKGVVPVLRIEGLTKTYDDGTEALKGVDLVVEPGEFVVVIGLSRSGKSTLLRCINRLVEPTAGRIYVDDEDIIAATPERLRELRMGIGMIFQQFNLVGRAGVLTNVLAGRLGVVKPLWSLINRFPKAEVENALRNLEKVGILEKAYNRANSLSGGQQQRVGIARALMQEPRLLLADEPVASLDPATSHSVLKFVEEINKVDGITVVCSLHFLSLARRYASRIVALKEGRLVFDGSPQEIDDNRFRQIYGEEAIRVEIA